MSSQSGLGYAGLPWDRQPFAGTPASIVQRPPALCPVCVGKTRVKADFYPVNVGESQVVGEWVICRTCGGRGIV